MLLYLPSGTTAFLVFQQKQTLLGTQDFLDYFLVVVLKLDRWSFSWQAPAVSAS
jgi:hypothetical protein